MARGWGGDMTKLRSREWFNNPDDPEMTALYFGEIPELRADDGGIAFGQADHCYCANW